jgi:hypothetical protein
MCVGSEAEPPSYSEFWVYARNFPPCKWSSLKKKIGMIIQFKCSENFNPQFWHKPIQGGLKDCASRAVSFGLLQTQMLQFLDLYGEVGTRWRGGSKSLVTAWRGLIKNPPSTAGAWAQGRQLQSLQTPTSTHTSLSKVHCVPLPNTGLNLNNMCMSTHF